MVANLKKLRNEFNISQQQLADVIGVSQQSINKYENHNIEPDIETLKNMAKFFNTSIDYLVGFDNNGAEFGNAQELLRLFNLMTAEQQSIFIEQGKAFVNANDKSTHSNKS
ncbi:MAG: helix-turn-helix transcriptional regulator [Eubacterium sp.]